MSENCPFEVSPYAESNQIKNEQIRSLNYTNQDFWSLKTKLVEFLRERFGENGTHIKNAFNDLVESSIAIMLIENWAFLGDTLSFKIDQIVNELFIDTVTEPENAFRLCQLVGFNPTPPIPASSMWSVTINSVLDFDLEIETPYTIEVGTEDGLISIELFAADSRNNPIYDQPIIISSGSFNNYSVVGLEGRTFTDNYTGTGLTLQSYQTSLSSVIFDSVSVQVDGVLWEKVDYFTDSQPRKEYRIEFDSEYRAYIIFGNNRAGLSPAKGSNIQIKARTGGGTAGNITTGFVEYQGQVQVIGVESSIPINFRNYTKGENGYEGDTIEDIRRKLPSYLRSQNRAVTGLDYQTLSEQFATPYHGQIGKSKAILRNHGCAGNVVDLYVLSRDGTSGLSESSDELKQYLAEFLEEKKMITDYLCIKDGEIIEVDVSVEVILSRTNKKFEQEIKTNIENNINNFFILNNWEFGQNLRENDLIKHIYSTKYVKSFNVVFTTNEEANSGSTVIAKFNEIIRPSVISVSFMYE